MEIGKGITYGHLKNLKTETEQSVKRAGTYEGEPIRNFRNKKLLKYSVDRLNGKLNTAKKQRIGELEDRFGALS